ncbi:MAG TPA: S8 family serine peptidase [Pyrinomonadaceae bacterium]|nr:S8 family serine peptidase [Pyrinomonadaceae bacterium]
MKNSRRTYKKKSGRKLPINLIKIKKQPGPSGFIIIRLAAHISLMQSDDLGKLWRLKAILEQYQQIPTRRLIRSVAPEKLLALEKKAASSQFPPLHSLTSYWRLDCRALDPHAIENLVKTLQALPEVDLVYQEQVVIPPVVDPTNDGYAERQDYLEAANVGIGAHWAWMQANGDGAGVGFVDLEGGWFVDHEDLKGKAPVLIFNDNNASEDERNHGTAVLGQVVGEDNSVGIIGVAPGVTSVRLVSHYEAADNTDLHVADAIAAALDVMAPGDVLLLEVQRGFLPTETDPGDWTAIRLASALGVIVIEPAGNGGEDLDLWATPASVRFFDRSDADNFQDSGAIMVGSCDSAEPHNRFLGSGVGSESNFGSRVDCFAWGENITSAGYGDLDRGDDQNTRYTRSFGGTSGASAIIAGAALIVQGKYQVGGGRLSPAQMRALLSHPDNGTPQGPVVGGLIGVMPNLQVIIQGALGLAPDVYLRDDVGDTGVIPSAGAISASPDIIVLPALEETAATLFGEGGGNENSNLLGSRVEFGQDNFIYVRMKNRNTVAAVNTTATVYWSDPSTLVTPNRWHRIGTTDGIDVPAGDTLVVANPITWPAADIPAAGHYCFVAILNQASDLAPLVPPATDWDGFRAFIRNNNNVTWRNFNVINDVVDESIQSFMISGAPDETRVFDLEIVQQLPEHAKVALETPLSLFASLPGDSFLDVRIDRSTQTASFSLPKLRCLPLPDVRLSQNSQYRCRLIVTGLEEANGHSVAIRQIYDELEVGRITWHFSRTRETR